MATRSDLADARSLGTLVPYLESTSEARRLVELCVEPLLAELPDVVEYVDLGGANGVLAAAVRDDLEASGRTVRTIVVDANARELEAARRRGLGVLQANLQDVTLADVHLMTMRLVNHYNAPAVQQRILDVARNGLRVGGWLVCQIEGGGAELARLRTAIAGLAAGVDGGGRYWTGDAEFQLMLQRAGFPSPRLAGRIEFAAVPLRAVLEAAWDRLGACQANGLCRDVFFASALALAEDTRRSGNVAELVSIAGELAVRSVHSIWSARHP